MNPKKGSIAVCSRGKLGLILSDEPVEVTYDDGSAGMAWTGIHLSPGLLGRPWSSRNPSVVGDIRAELRQYDDLADGFVEGTRL